MNTPPVTSVAYDLVEYGRTVLTVPTLAEAKAARRLYVGTTIVPSTTSK